MTETLTTAARRPPRRGLAATHNGKFIRVGNAWHAALFFLLTAALFWVVWIYGTGLRDPRYLDGWILAGGMGLQLWLHIGRRSIGLSPRSAVRWRAVHIFIGYLLVGVFVSHSEMTLPDTAFEWALAMAFTLVALSGLFGMYLSWWGQAKHLGQDRLTSERIPARREELARAVHAAVHTSDPTAAAIALPVAPYDDWIIDLYTTRLNSFFSLHHNVLAHLTGSERPLKALTDEIDDLSTYLDPQGQAKLAAVRHLVVEKHRLDFARVHLALTRGWLMVHVPVTYVLVVLALLHVVVVYAFSSGDW